mgnify:CR=1 FL=1
MKKQPVKKAAKIGRNDPCPCGSGLNDVHKLSFMDEIPMPQDGFRQEDWRNALHPQGGGKPPYEADGLMTDLPGVALVVYSADCIPILFYDRRGPGW